MSNQVRVEDLRRDLDALTNSRRRHVVSAARGRDADHPGKIPARGWADILWRCWQEVSDANLFLVAGGVTYAVLLALFPGLAALVAIYGGIFPRCSASRPPTVLSI